jgi:hypothetical protein
MSVIAIIEISVFTKGTSGFYRIPNPFAASCPSNRSKGRKIMVKEMD